MFRSCKFIALSFALSVAAFGQVDATDSVELLLENPIQRAGFGQACGISGDWLFIGDDLAAKAATPDLKEGAVRIFKQTPGGWVLDQTIYSPEPGNGYRFGAALDVDGTDLIVSASNWGWHIDNPFDPYSGSGKAYLFELQGEQWTLTLTVRPTMPDAFTGTFRVASFGRAVTIDGDRMAVGASSTVTLNPPGTPFEFPNGVTYTYRRVAGNWAFDEAIPAPSIWDHPNPGIWSLFGFSLDIDGDRIAIGAAGDLEGLAFTYIATPQGWQFEDEVVCPLPANSIEAHRNFGTSIAIDGNRMAVGMPSFDCSSPFCPSLVAIYEMQNGSWVLVQVLDEIVGEPGGSRARMGASLVLKGDYLVVGASGVVIAGHPERQLRLYRYTPGVGFELETIYRNAHDSSQVVNSWLGRRIAADFDRGLIIGGDPQFQFRRPGQADWERGLTLLFDIELGQTTACIGSPNTRFDRSHLAVTGSLEVAQDRLTLHATHLPQDEFSLFLYGQPGAPFPLASGGNLCLTGGGPIHRLLPPGMVGAFGERYLDINFNTPREATNLMPGTTWAFQVWHRDSTFGWSFTGTSNAVLVTLE